MAFFGYTAEQAAGAGRSGINAGAEARSLAVDIGNIAGGAGVSALLSPLMAAATAEFSTRTGIGSLGHKRNTAYEQNRTVANTIPGVGDLLSIYYRKPLTAEGNPPSRQWLDDMLLNYGISSGQSGWNNIIEYSCTTEQLSNIIVTYKRNIALGDAAQAANLSNLNWHFQKNQIARSSDRTAILNRPYSWTPHEVLCAYKLGILDQANYNAWLDAAGISTAGDRQLFDGLAPPLPIHYSIDLYKRGLIPDAKLGDYFDMSGVRSQEIQSWIRYLWYTPPGPSELLSFARRQVWSNPFTQQWGLDEDLQASPLSKVWWNAQGFGAASQPIDGENGVPTDWLAAHWRASRAVPGMGEALRMQWRLRPNNPQAPAGPNGQQLTWTQAETVQSLKMQGYPQYIIDRMLGSAFEPLPLRIANRVLLESLKHPEIKQQLDAIPAQNNDPIASIYLDHGIRPEIASLASATLRAAASDSYNAEYYRNKESLNAQERKVYSDQYRIGIITQQQYIDGVTSEFYPIDLATNSSNMIGGEVKAEVAAAQIKSVNVRGFPDSRPVYGALRR